MRSLGILGALGIAVFGVFLYMISPVLTPLILLLLLWFLLFPIRRESWAIWILAAATTLFIMWLVARAWPALAPFITGAVMAYLLEPMVDKLERAKFPRLLAAIVVVLVIIGLLVALSFLVLPTVASQISQIISKLPESANTISGYLERLEERLEPLGVPPGTLDIDAVKQYVLGTDRLLERLAQGALSVTKAATTALGTIINIFLVFVVSFYLLIEMNRLMAWIGSLLPAGSRSRIENVFKQVDDLIGRWFRGQLTIALIVGVLIMGGLALLSTPYAALLGLVAGVLNIIPTIGIILTLVVTLLLTPTVNNPLNYLIKAGAVYAVVQLLENVVISPRIMSARVGLHPAVVILSVMVFAHLFGPVGVLLAVPIASLIRLGGTWALDTYRASPSYQTEDDSADEEESCNSNS